MKNSIILSALTLVAVGLLAARLSAGPANSPTTAPTTAPSTQPVNKMCAVEHEDAIDPKVTTVYKGKTIGFCCKDCLPKFKADPEKYMKDLK